MASKKKSRGPVKVPTEEILENVNNPVVEEEHLIIETPDIPAKRPNKPVKEPNRPAPGPKYPIGSIVFISKNADADLNGFKLFPQYKKYTYTVEAYDDEKSIYSLRRLNLSLKLKEADIVAPSEREASPLARKQY